MRGFGGVKWKETSHENSKVGGAPGLLLSNLECFVLWQTAYATHDLMYIYVD